MKKVIILSITAMLSVVAFAQDTIPKNNRDSSFMKDKNVDSILNQSQQNLNRDTTLVSPKPQSTFNKNNRTDSLDSTAMNGNSKMKSSVDTMKAATMNQQNENRAMADAAATIVLTDRVMMKDEKMYVIKDGQIAPLDKTYKLETGAIVSSKGEVKFPSGKTVILKNGQFIELKPIEKMPDAKTTTPQKKPVVKKKINSPKN